MLYDERKKKGIRQKCLPEPNLTKIEMSKHSSIFEVFTKSIKLYYREFSDVTVNNIMVADCSGNIIDIDNLSSGNWEITML